MTDTSLNTLRNRTFAELAVGDSARIERVLSMRDIQLFAAVSGDLNPQHLDPDFAAGTPFQGIIAHGMWGASLISAVLGTQLPGPGTIYLDQSLSFRAPVRIGDRVTVEVRVTALEARHRHARLACTCTLPDGTIAIQGEALVQAPDKTVECPRSTLPDIRIQPSGADSLQTLLTHVRGRDPIRVAVVHSCDEVSLRAVLEARRENLIEPVLVAPRARLEQAAQALGASLEGLDVRDAAHSHAAADMAVALARAGEVEALMKGSLHTDELMGAVVRADGLRTKRRVSHCYLMQVPQYPRPFIITDAAINIAPTLEQKADIIRNAIDLAHAIGVARPRVAILAAVETISTGMPATLDAAALCKMADRGQITGGLLDGPLAFDNAVSQAAAHIKGIRSDVAGRADILVAPDLESGNMLAKQLMYLGDATSAGIVLGARVPIILTSRADSYESRIASCAVALLLAHHYRSTPL
ncbi:bifunctional enoyl-CoA hydratase/phosphate acetyltransferase [Castellaniella caeni]|uniref:bifunctional enoyl-CoA hydratase/phosphate acetyltransferase n=1 Tax=Castellaniella caeni TaxID=266123 RepID=UPI00083492B8|nr:bifunctional enoyl-CoA hydratase/phosphate acetyltransferase [Castellaniella caeni]